MSISRLGPLPLVFIRWRDAHALAANWTSDEEYTQDLADPSLLLCESVGFLIEDTENHLAFCRDWTAGHRGGVMILPREMVVELVRLDPQPKKRG